MSTSSSSVARGSLYRPYGRSTSTGSISSVENLPPRTIARVSKEVRDLMKSPPGGISLVVDPETGMPASLGEIVVSLISWQNAKMSHCVCLVQALWQLASQVLRMAVFSWIHGQYLEIHVRWTTKSTVPLNSRHICFRRFFLQFYENRRRLKAPKELHTKTTSFV